jgi:hypothetical protein
LADGDAVGFADADGFALGEADGFAPTLGDVEGLDDGLAPAGALPEGVGFGVEAGASARGRDELFGRTAKKRGGRLKVGTSSQNGACGSSEK